MGATSELRDGVLVIRLDNPPVNALGAALRKALGAALERAGTDPSVKGLVITGAGAMFSSGADIREFGKPPEPPSLPDLLVRIAGLKIPTVAAINGAAMGGGLETALACALRIAAPGAVAALPEVRLGLIPGAGGTQRLPRLVGMMRAADWITSGKTVGAAEALSAGLFDDIVEGDLLARAVFLASEAGRAAREAMIAARANFTDDPAALDKFAGEVARKARGQISPLKALEAVRASALPLDDGLGREREIFLECLASEQRQALIHLFFAERAAAKIPEIEGAEPAAIKSIAVIGAGTMGAGIAIACAERGFEVLLYDASAPALGKATAKIAAHFDDAAAKGRMTRDLADAAKSRVSAHRALADMGAADLFIEAVIERMDVKKDVFAAIDAIARPGAVLATNTSYLDVDEIASATRRPEDVIGMHFFSPANVMRLLEVVRAKRASPRTLATALSVGRKLGKISVVAGVCDGFIGNRIFRKYRQQADYLVEDGAAPQDVDRVMRGFGFAMGPFEVSDLAGLDIGWHNRRREDATRDGAERYVEIADRLYEMGRLGQKTGAGWYRYENGRTPLPDPAVDAVIDDCARKKGIVRAPVDDATILGRLLGAMTLEGARIVEEGIARSAGDVDLVLVHGYGFPAHRGGPMHYAASAAGRTA